MQRKLPYAERISSTVSCRMQTSDTLRSIYGDMRPAFAHTSLTMSVGAAVEEAVKACLTTESRLC